MAAMTRRVAGRPHGKQGSDQHEDGADDDRQPAQAVKRRGQGNDKEPGRVNKEVGLGTRETGPGIGQVAESEAERELSAATERISDSWAETLWYSSSSSSASAP